MYKKNVLYIVKKQIECYNVNKNCYKLEIATVKNVCLHFKTLFRAQLFILSTVLSLPYSNFYDKLRKLND